jgi:pimeloyl-ACP methyl ester carboxylesterase
MSTGLSEKVFLEVNGARQGILLRTVNPGTPVLLHLHGGLPESFLTERRPSPLEELFTVAWWEQRGAGLSYSPAISPQTITAEQLIADTLVVARHLVARFGQDRIHLLGHSGGSFVGIQAAARAPELFRSYIGVAQMVDQLRSERLAWEYMTERFRERGDRRMVRRLEAAEVTLDGGVPSRYLAVRDRAMHALGVGTTRRMRSVITGLVLPSLRARQYSWPEKARLWRGKMRAGVSPLWQEMTSSRIPEMVPSLAIPAYFLHGRHDYTCSYDLARSFARTFRAPARGFYTFESSAHSPVLEEPARARRILLEDVLRGETRLADEL